MCELWIPPINAYDFGKRDDLVSLTERGGHVEEPRAEPEGSIAHAVAHQRTHVLELVWRGRTVHATEHRIWRWGETFLQRDGRCFMPGFGCC